MLDQQIALLEAEPPGGLPWAAPALVAAVAASGALLFAWAGEPVYAGIFAGGMVAMLVAAFVIERRGISRAVEVPAPTAPDFALAASVLDASRDAAALTDASGRLVLANSTYRERFGQRLPDQAASGERGVDRLRSLRAAAWRDGTADDSDCLMLDGQSKIGIERVGASGDLLLWRFGRVERAALDILKGRVTGFEGDMFTHSGVLAAVIDEDGRVTAMNSAFLARAVPMGTDPTTLSFDDVVSIEGDFLKLRAEGEAAPPMRLVHVPVDPAGGAGLTLLLDRVDQGEPDSTNVQALLDLLPLGLALVDRDGRFLTMNKAFRTAGGISEGKTLVYPSDLVIKEDKGAVADSVRRHARGPAMSRDLPVRIHSQPGEPVALTVAGLRGLGDAVVLLLLKDNSEEAKLKRQVAQATKMQAVGQLAGGVAHDFNNILTAIIGHCDLMLMRHAPGDSDYDDIQQIKSNSNRAAGLTRQLLAFSRQQTLAPANAPASRRGQRGLAPAQAAARRDRRAQRQAWPRRVSGPRRSGPARTGHRQPCRQRARRDAVEGRRRADHPDLFGQVRPGRRTG